MDSLEKTWENPQKMHGFLVEPLGKIHKKCMDSLRKLLENSKKTRVSIEAFWKFAEIHGCLLPRDLGGTTANPPTCNEKHGGNSSKSLNAKNTCWLHFKYLSELILYLYHPEW